VREQAAAVGAHVVLVASRYSHTISGATPLTIPSRTTSVSTGTATAFGRGGAATAMGSGMTTTYGSQTVMMPYTVQRSDFAVLFFAKSRSRVGIIAVPIDDATRRRLETNYGLRVEVVTENSSAFQANVLPGDVLLSVAGEPVSSWQNFVAILDRREGSTVAFEFDRDGRRISKEIEIRRVRSQADK
jgi:membrane-associated protease RseP (regulator of RpoE activity)